MGGLFDSGPSASDMMRMQMLQAQLQQRQNEQAFERQQQAYLDAFERQQEENRRAQAASLTAARTNQITPYGTLTYEDTGQRDEYGNPVYRAVTRFSDDQQRLLDLQELSQRNIGETASDLIANVFSRYATTPNLTEGVDSLVNQRMEHQLGYVNPFFEPQTTELDNRLRNQGLSPGTPAYDNAMRTLRDNQNQSVLSYLASVQPEAFNQAITEYELPMMTAFKLMQAAQPGSLNLINTPTVNRQSAAVNTAQYSPVNMSEALRSATSILNADQANRSNMLSGLFGIAGTVLGGPIGGAIGGGLGGLFGGGGGLTSPNSWIPTVTMG